MIRGTGNGGVGDIEIDRSILEEYGVLPLDSEHGSSSVYPLEVESEVERETERETEREIELGKMNSEIDDKRENGGEKVVISPLVKALIRESQGMDIDTETERERERER